MASSPHGFPVPPPLVAVSALLAQRALTPDARPSVPRRLVAGALTAAGVSFSLNAARGFGRRGTTTNPVKLGGSTALVTDGPFAYTRNPMYVGLAAALVANALARGSMKALLPVAGYVAVIDRLQIPREEASMAALFGDEYAAYRARVPRWVGRVGD
jgi:protein-S-isoprenylcysteine O-methyltransferase Ste14